LRGELQGEEDVTLQGRVEGKIDFPQSTVTVGKDGRLKANVKARVIVVEGEVEGDLVCAEQILIKRSGSVRGNLVAPRVTLEDGCKFKGAIDMDPQSAARVSASATAPPAPGRAAAAASGPASAPAPAAGATGTRTS
jgi:cytoskeletal protein CcmA (bactofilin family)